jgi:hypothetical protein
VGVSVPPTQARLTLGQLTALIIVAVSDLAVLVGLAGLSSVLPWGYPKAIVLLTLCVGCLATVVVAYASASERGHRLGSAILSRIRRYLLWLDLGSSLASVPAYWMIVLQRLYGGGGAAELLRLFSLSVAVGFTLKLVISIVAIAAWIRSRAP